MRDRFAARTGDGVDNFALRAPAFTGFLACLDPPGVSRDVFASSDAAVGVLCCGLSAEGAGDVADDGAAFGFGISTLLGPFVAASGDFSGPPEGFLKKLKSDA